MRKRVVLASLLVVAMVGCSKYEALDFQKVPPELADCKFFKLTDDSGTAIKVARCPNSTTTTSYSQGKSTATTVVSDGGLPPPLGVPSLPPGLATAHTAAAETPVVLNYRGRVYLRQDERIIAEQAQ